MALRATAHPRPRSLVKVMETVTRLFNYIPAIIGLIWPLWLPAIGWLAYGTIRRSLSLKQAGALWALLLAPFLLVVWGAVATRWGETLPFPVLQRKAEWPFWVLHVLGLLQLVLATALGYQHRAVLRYVVPTALAALVFTAVAWWIGAMSIANDWL